MLALLPTAELMLLFKFFWEAVSDWLTLDKFEGNVLVLLKDRLRILLILEDEPKELVGVEILLRVLVGLMVGLADEAETSLAFSS